MNAKLLLSVAMVVIIAGSTISMADGQGNSGSPGVHVIGNFSLSVASNNTLQNLIYTKDGSSYTFASYMQVEGDNVTNVVSTSSVSSNLLFSTPNATLESSGKNALIVMTVPTTTGVEDMKVVLNGTATKVSASSRITLGSIGMVSFSANVWTIYRLNVSGASGYFITDGSVVSSGSTLQVSPRSSNLLRIGTTNDVLISAFVTHEGLESILHNIIEKRNDHKFTYNSITGMVNGTFVGFNFDKSTGVISNYTANIYGGLKVFSRISATGNGSLGSSRYLSLMNDGNVSLLGSIFLYANASYVYTLHNNPSLNIGALLNNGTMKFDLSSGFNVTKIHLSAGVQSNLNASVASSSSNVFMNETLGITERTQATATAYLIAGHGLNGFLYINGDNGTAYNNTTGTLSVSANNSSVAHIVFIAPPGLQKLAVSSVKPIEYAISHGKMAAEISIENLGNGAVNYSTYFNNSMQANVTSVGHGKVSIVIGSSNHLGTNIAIFVNNSFISSSGKIYVYFDGKLSTLQTNASAVLNSTSSTSSEYGVVQENGGVLVIVHVPHFSDHNVTISSTPLNSSALPFGLTLEDLGAIGVVIVILIAGSAIIYRRRKK